MRMEHGITQGGDRNLAFVRNRKVGPDVSHLNERSGANMLASPLPIYLGCAGLIVGGLGLGAHHMLGGGSGSSTNKDAAMEQPLFARSVEQATLPATQWPSTNVDVAYYGPMVELLTQPTSSVPAPLADPSRAATAAQQEQQPPARDVAPAPQSPSTTAQMQENRAPRHARWCAIFPLSKANNRGAREISASGMMRAPAERPPPPNRSIHARLVPRSPYPGAPAHRDPDRHRTAGRPSIRAPLPRSR